MSYTLIFSQITKYIPLLLRGLGVSILIACIGMAVGTLLGVLCAVVRVGSCRPAIRAVNGYIEVFRNTPMLIQMYLLYFGFAQFQVQISPFASAILAMALNNGAYTAVIFETGLKAVDVGQWEASEALGMTRPQEYLHIIIPQAFRVVVPPLTNQFISLFLFSSVASTVSVPELLSATLQVDSMTMRTFEVFIVTTLLYLLVTTVISVGSSMYERRFKY